MGDKSGIAYQHDSWEEARQKFGGYGGALSKRQLNLLECVESFHAEWGYAASIRELMMMTEITSTSVVDYNLKALERLGLITRQSGISRSTVLTDDGRRLVKRC